MENDESGDVAAYVQVSLFLISYAPDSSFFGRMRGWKSREKVKKIRGTEARTREASPKTFLSLGTVGKLCLCRCPLDGKIRIKQKNYSNSSWGKTKRKKFFVTADGISGHGVDMRLGSW